MSRGKGYAGAARRILDIRPFNLAVCCLLCMADYDPLLSIYQTSADSWMAYMMAERSFRCREFLN